MPLRLLPFHESLAEALFATRQHPSLYEFIEESPPTDFDAFRARCKRLEHTFSPDGKERWLNWAIELEGEIVGCVQATVYVRMPDGTRTAEFAYSIHPSVWGKGMAYAACTQMLEILRNELGVTTLWLTIVNGNARSIKLAQRLGLAEVSAKQYPYTNYAEGDVVMFGKL